MAAENVDGMDVEAVWEAARKAADTIRRLSVPYFLELRTYRFRAHSMFDAELYRSKHEVEQWKHHCPIAGHIERLQGRRQLTPQDVQALEAEVAREIAEAVAFAEAGTWEPVEDLEKDVYARPPLPEGNQASSERRPLN
jgi:TPP-dependent pyruvate/acetoin dehydrogenase alpha subunit